MTHTIKQAGKLVFWTLFCTLVAARAEAAVPVNLPSPAAKASKTDAQAPDKTVSLGEFVDGVTGSLGKLLPSWGEGGAKEEKKPDAQPQMIKAKRLDGEAPAKTDAAAPPPQQAAPPYKVYNAPMIAAEPQTTAQGPAIYATGRSGTAYETPRSAAPIGAGFDPIGVEPSQPIDTSKPPPLPARVQRDLGLVDDGPPPSASMSSGLGAALARIPEVRQPRGVASNDPVPPISALPKQFFPVFPAGATSETLPQLLPVASSALLEDDHANIMRAVIVIHDISRNAAEGVATLMTLMGPDRASTLIIAPQFPLSIDVMRFAQYLPDEGRAVARWPVETGWHTGADSVAAPGQKGISSFMALDLLLLLLDDRNRFPSLQEVVIVGHGMGGDFVQRYAATGQASDVLEKDRLPVRFVVANPSSYLYFTNSRPAESGSGFTRPDEKACPNYNDYPYGLGALPPYARRIGANDIRLNYPQRKIIYLIGDKLLSDHYLDKNCGAQLQGKDRTSRGRAYERHILQSFGETTLRTQSFVTVTNAGYDPVALFGSRCGLSALFGDGVCQLGY